MRRLFFLALFWRAARTVDVYYYWVGSVSDPATACVFEHPGVDGSPTRPRLRPLSPPSTRATSRPSATRAIAQFAQYLRFKEPWRLPLTRATRPLEPQVA